MKVIQKSYKKRIYSIRLTEEHYEMIKYLKNNNVDVPSMIRSFIEDIYENSLNEDKDNIYLNLQ